MEWDPHDCPECKEPSVQPMSVVDGRRHYRCHECLWSWVMVVEPNTPDTP